MYDERSLERITLDAANYASNVENSFFEYRKAENVNNRAGVGILKTVKLDDPLNMLDDAEFLTAKESVTMKTFKRSSNILHSKLKAIIQRNELVGALFAC